VGFISFDKKVVIMTGRLKDVEYHISKSRLETLVDGIFAIAMTLLVLGIDVPKPGEAIAPSTLAAVLFGIVPQVFLFVVAFLVLALFWLGHHRQFHFVSKVDPALLWINILILIAIVFVPFSTDVAGDYPFVPVAVLLFHTNMFVVGFLFAVQWRYIWRHGHLCEPVPDENIIRNWVLRSSLIPSVAAVAMVIAVASPLFSLLTYFALPVGTFLLRRVPAP